jgi:MYXO-CTERM domain-containing protein
MKLVSSLTCAAGLAVGAFTASASAALYIPGDFNTPTAWNNNGPQMTETSPGSGNFAYALTGQSGGSFHEFKVLATGGDWGSSFTNDNCWVTANGAGSVTIGATTNTYADGWSPSTHRISSDNPETAWTAVGDWQGWNNGNPATAMSLLSGSIYSYSTTLAPGSYQYKAVNSGSWNAIGSDSRSVNAGTLFFTTDAVNNQVQFLVDAGAGTVRVNVTPAPSAAGLLGMGTLLASRRRRR